MVCGAQDMLVVVVVTRFRRLTILPLARGATARRLRTTLWTLGAGAE